MTKVLGPVLYQNVEVYINDILIHHATKAKHISGVQLVQNSRHWLKHTQLPVHILTDHKNLESFVKLKILNRRQIRWLELLTHYNYKIHYRPGDKNCAADALSRHAKLQPPRSEERRVGKEC